jgi:hypothetical protein
MSYLAKLEQSLLLDTITTRSFPEQMAPVLSQARKKFVEGPRRCGKSVSFLNWVLTDHHDFPGAMYGYAAKTAGTAKRIIWALLHHFNETLGIDAKLNQQRLECTFPNKATLFLTGADQRVWMDRFRGPGFRGIGLDEAAFYALIDMQQFTEELEPSLIDFLGQLWLMTTPGRKRRGFCFDLHEERVSGWDRFFWLPDRNPYVAVQWKHAHDEIHRLNPRADENPTHLREWHGQWIEDLENLLYQPSRIIESYVRDPRDHYIFGLDIGETMGYAVSCWSDAHPRHVVLEAFRRTGQLVPDVVKEIARIRRQYPGISAELWGDPEAKHFLGELRKRWNVPIKDAVKVGKMDFINLRNSDAACGRIEHVKGTTADLQEEHEELTRTTDRHGRACETAHQRRDVADAELYTYRRSHFWRYEPLQKGPAYGSPEWEAKQVQKLEDEEERQLIERERRSTRTARRSRRLA